MKKVLIANRGEIAVRIARACTAAELTSGAVYSEPDADALHVRLSDEAYALDGSASADTYLNMDKLLAIAKKAGADAVHPGYGFLSENADFADAVQDAGLIWIGPSPDAIRSLGNKVTAREIAVKVGAPLVPGSDGPVANAEDVRAFAEEFGVPVAIKAAYGGGGRGMRIAHRMEDIDDAFESAVREATVAFGRGECFAERFLDKPRHVEAQVLADTHGNVVVVGTRDCSLQRRHQKRVEEAPAPFLSDEQTHQIYDAAKAVCRAAGYSGASTVEFLVAADGTVAFLEVNTRLQVEHPHHRGNHRHRPRAGAVPHRCGRAAAAHGRSCAARALDRIPAQRRGRGPRLPALARYRRRVPRSHRPGRPARHRHRDRERYRRPRPGHL